MEFEMKKTVLLTIAMSFTLACAQQPSGDVADTVYTNGRIYTVNEAQPWAEAVAIKDGKFLVVGSNADVEAVTGDGTEVVDLGGGFAMPGIGDTHIHQALVMPKRAFCGLPGTFYEPTEEQTIEALEECIANYPEDREWFIAAGWTAPAMSDETLTREFLDKLIPDRPAYVEDETGGHQAWFNTKAMEAAGITRNFEDSPEGYFSRTADGDIAGRAYEGAVNPLLDALPPFDVELKKIAFSKLMDEALSKGVTAFGEAYVGMFDGDLQAWQELYQEGKIHQHVNLYLKGNLGTAELTPVETLEEWWNSYDLPGIKGVKLGMDGSIESFTAPLIDGYAKTDVEPVESVLPGDQLDEDAGDEPKAEPLIPAEPLGAVRCRVGCGGIPGQDPRHRGRHGPFGPGCLREGHQGEREQSPAAPHRPLQPGASGRFPAPYRPRCQLHGLAAAQCADRLQRRWHQARTQARNLGPHVRQSRTVGRGNSPGEPHGRTCRTTVALVRHGSLHHAGVPGQTREGAHG